MSRDCLRSRHVSAVCSVCGGHPEVCHMPLKAKGFRCARHCEACHPQLEQQGVLGLGTEQAETETAAAEGHMVLHGQRPGRRRRISD
jgi:hypothetical protein